MIDLFKHVVAIYLVSDIFALLFAGTRGINACIYAGLGRSNFGKEVGKGTASSFIFFLVRITKSVKETQGLVGGAEALQAGIHEHLGTQVHSLGMGIWSLAFPF